MRKLLVALVALALAGPAVAQCQKTTVAGFCGAKVQAVQVQAAPVVVQSYAVQPQAVVVQSYAVAPVAVQTQAVVVQQAHVQAVQVQNAYGYGGGFRQAGFGGGFRARAAGGGFGGGGVINAVNNLVNSPAGQFTLGAFVGRGFRFR